MLSNRKETLGTMGKTDKGLGPMFSPKAKGAVISNVPSIDPALKGLAFNKRKNFKLG